MKEKIRDSKGRFLKGIISPYKGIKGRYSQETRKKMSIANKGRKPWNEGKTRIYSLETIEKMRLAKLGKDMRESHHFWKGDNVGYNALHDWINRHKPKSNVCENCNLKKRLEVANISGEYMRDINDFKWLCHRCHMIEDGRMARVSQIVNVRWGRR